ncbi:unnamed protein product [Cyprideis torosa]|uniref:Uncharacterized protein n=1 Tax=Cyprideis torosa TaxID=163714 RepID=A0A7R8ZFY1_9CRUS|nr:unnamed protein product [Cyprideis torosa]CAG0880202.1 unnamed protein product [Cyprideis torosa]
MKASQLICLALCTVYAHAFPTNPETPTTGAEDKKVEIEVIRIFAPDAATLEEAFNKESYDVHIPDHLPNPSDRNIPLEAAIDAHLDANVLPTEPRDERDAFADPLSPLSMSPLYKSYNRFRHGFHEHDEAAAGELIPVRSLKAETIGSEAGRRGGSRVFETLNTFGEVFEY